MVCWWGGGDKNGRLTTVTCIGKKPDADYCSLLPGPCRESGQLRFKIITDELFFFWVRLLSTTVRTKTTWRINWVNSHRIVVCVSLGSPPCVHTWVHWNWQNLIKTENLQSKLPQVFISLNRRLSIDIAKNYLTRQMRVVTVVLKLK